MLAQGLVDEKGITGGIHSQRTSAEDIYWDPVRFGGSADAALLSALVSLRLVVVLMLCNDYYIPRYSLFSGL